MSITRCRSNHRWGGGGGIEAIEAILNNSVISGNSTLKESSPGGGIKANILFINHCAITANSTNGFNSSGGGVYARIIASIDESTITGNSTAGFVSGGGGIYSRGTVNIRKSVIGENKTTFNSFGGGIYVAGDLNVASSSICGNSADEGGGGIYAESSANITASTISSNFTTGTSVNGGGIYARSSANITASTISDNYTNGWASRGGGIFARGDLSISNSTISNNSATDSGGGIYGLGSITATDCVISGNASANDGGGVIRLSGAGSTSTLTLVRDTISENKTEGVGGGIASSGAATISECDISNNDAYEGGGIYCGGDLTLADSRVTSNIASGYDGGGIVVTFGQLRMSRSTVSGNQTTRNGGGAYCLGDVSIESSTISNNSATLAGGGIAAAKSIELLNSTVSQNTASLAGGIWCGGSNATITQSTIYRNQSSGAGGGVFMESGALSLDDAIVASNFAKSGPDATGLLGASIHSRFSLIGNNTGSGLAATPIGSPDINGNVIGGSTYEAMINPQLGPLADNGGPTQTHALLAGSPALNSGDPSAAGISGNEFLFDQRGAPFLRVFNGRIDMGAYGRISVPTSNLVVDTLDDVGNMHDAHLSLREAIGLANGFVDSLQTITFAPALTANGPATIRLSRGELTLTDPLTLVGPGADLLSIDAGGNDPTPSIDDGKGSRVFMIDNGDDSVPIAVSISGLALTGGDISDSGGAIYSREPLSLTSSTIQNNSAGLGGGLLSAATLNLVDCAVTGNSATNSGGGITMSYANLIAIDCTITGNTAGQDGGGGIRGYGSNRSMTINNSVLSNNSTSYVGGGIYAYGPVTLNNAFVAHNIALGGGGILTSGTLTVTNSLIAHNTATMYAGGGLQVGSGASLNVLNSTITGNSANAWHGGGIAAQGAVSVSNSTLSENSALEGGALYCGSSSRSVTISYSTIAANNVSSPSGKGGGIYFIGGYRTSLTLNDSLVATNSGPSGSDLFATPAAGLVISYSLIGDKSGTSLAEAPVGSPDSNGNLIGGPVHGLIDPLLGPLADNGGFTMPDGSHVLTHALLAGSPAINTGGPTAAMGVSGVPAHDQRSAPFIRVYGGRIDIGAFELQPAMLLGDYNANNFVDAADYVIWRKSLGSTSELQADGNGDRQVTNADYAVWRANFGSSSVSSATVASRETTPSSPAYVDPVTRIAPPRRPALVASRRGDFRPSVGEHALLAVATSDSAGTRGISEPLSSAVATIARGQYSPRAREEFDSLDKAFASLNGASFANLKLRATQ